jgi:hypothetical protein
MAYQIRTYFEDNSRSDRVCPAGKNPLRSLQKIANQLRRSMPNTVLEVHMRREHTPASPVGASYTLHSVYIARRLIATISVEEA